VQLYYFNAQDTIGTRGGTIAAAGAPTYYVAPSFAAVLNNCRRKSTKAARSP